MPKPQFKITEFPELELRPGLRIQDRGVTYLVQADLSLKRTEVDTGPFLDWLKLQQRKLTKR